MSLCIFISIVIMYVWLIRHAVHYLKNLGLAAMTGHQAMRSRISQQESICIVGVDLTTVVGCHKFHKSNNRMTIVSDHEH